MLHQLKPKSGATTKGKRLGRGDSAGGGSFCGRGCKGQGARKSGNVRPGFEGGQTPLVMRLPKLRGFKNVNKVIYQIVNVRDLNLFKDGEEVSIETLLEKRLIHKKGIPVKILGDGKLARKVSVKVQKVSTSARAKINAAGGKII